MYCCPFVSWSSGCCRSRHYDSGRRRISTSVTFTRLKSVLCRSVAGVTNNRRWFTASFELDNLVMAQNRCTSYIIIILFFTEHQSSPRHRNSSQSSKAYTSNCSIVSKSCACNGGNRLGSSPMRTAIRISAMTNCIMSRRFPCASHARTCFRLSSKRLRT